MASSHCNRNDLLLVVAASLAIAACSPKLDVENAPVDAEAVSGGRSGAVAQGVAEQTHLGGCILLDPAGAVPDDVYEIGAVTAADGIAPFSKELSVYGLRLVAREDASDDFLRLIAKAVEEMFPRDDGLDLAMQREVLANHYRYRAMIPVPVGEDFGFMEEDPDQFDLLTDENSICDVIMQDVSRGQVMEVLEHILHYVSDLGLHYAYPEVWGLHAESLLAQAMRQSIDAGDFDVSTYDGEFEEEEVRTRVLMQEFAYWFISTAWDLQLPYGPIEDEWQIRSASELRVKLPELYAAYEQTAARVMTAPSSATLQKIGPTRAEEGEVR